MEIITFERWSTLRIKNLEKLDKTFRKAPEMILIINDPRLQEELILLTRSKFNKLVTDNLLFKPEMK